MDVNLKNALIAKTVLRDSKVTTIGLIQTSYQEAYSKLSKSNNEGYKNHQVIYDKTLKIYKNLLKAYTIKNLLRNFINYDSYTVLIGSMKKINKISKSEVIRVIVRDSKPTIHIFSKSELYK